MTRYLNAKSGRARVTHPVPPPRITKQDAPYCVAKIDSLGRLPIGYCGPDCCRRPVRKDS